jgi:hypothetical protein
MKKQNTLTLHVLTNRGGAAVHHARDSKQLQKGASNTYAVDEAVAACITSRVPVTSAKPMHAPDAAACAPYCCCCSSSGARIQHMHLCSAIQLPPPLNFMFSNQPAAMQRLSCYRCQCCVAITAAPPDQLDT